MLIDHAEITVRGGHGGAAMPKKTRGPDGGNGGRGGDVYFKTSSNINLLNQFSKKDVFVAENGSMGARGNKTGKIGADLEIELPAGTSVIDRKTGELITEITKKGERFLICKGGRGGFWSTERPKFGDQIQFAEKGEQGEERKLILNLKLIADFGLIGLPNAGKSSLLNELTNAKAVIADYPFTTLEPNLGVFDGPPDGEASKVLADIPGLIEGASVGRGLGIAFLKHIEKVAVLLHCISCESLDVLRDYKTVRTELKNFKPELIKKPEIIVLTKTDTVDSEVVELAIKKLRKEARQILSISIHDYQSLEELKKVLLKDLTI